ncbi:hypothetical protein GXP67_30145 [Rhodocytophaga rosea]|uniref:DUF3575 domain-containing protein n=1 Tax=Rhodocytophaga rosea TaxID=2704465 RepID=A0A6C0GT43_9BACT|nr:hypothetical protein [Rhodocytophaga rosea]QHT70612.1 hypothetical protein GXP67_30145 [Rhodocytophaga rosea]
MQKTLLILLFSLIYVQTKAQQWSAQNALFVEFGDTYQLNYSINYSRIIHTFNTTAVSVTAGISLEPVSKSNFLQALFPVELTLFNGKQNHYFETGLSFVPGIYYDYYLSSPYLPEEKQKKILTKKEFGTTAGLRIGYRYQKKQGGLFFRAAFTPTFYTSFSPFDKTRVRILKDDCLVCFTSMRSYYDFVLEPGINISLGKSF